MTSDVDEISGKSFDYIIVGGGTAGCPLAATLSEKFSVLLVERGGSPFENPLVMEKKYYGFSLLETDEFSSPAQSFVSRDGVGNLRGRVLGGSSAINGGFYSRASQDFVKSAGWDEDMVEEAYEWVESRVVFQPLLTPWQFTVQLSLLEAGILPYNGYSLEHVEGTKIGGTVFDNFGTRHTSADLLREGNPENIVVLLNATVKNIIFHNSSDKDETRAAGISFIQSYGSPEETFVAYLNPADDSTTTRGDIILSAGAIGSPTILLLSGVGPPKHLRKFNIPVMVDLKGVGQQMKDSPCISLLADSQPLNRPADPPQVAGIARDLNFVVEAGILPISFNTTLIPVAAKLAFPVSKGRLKLNSTDPRQNPSVKFNYLSKEEDLKGVGRHMKDSPCISHMADSQPLNRPADPPQVAGVARDLKFVVEAGILPISFNTTLIPVAAKLAFPVSKGRLKLNSTDPRRNPSVKFNYLSREEDLRQCKEMVELLQQVVSSQAVTVFLGVERNKDILLGQGELSGFCKKNVRTFYHYHGGCSVGSVVDSDYRVYGVKGLRVVDGSTFLESPGTNPMATLMMLGRYQGMKILHDRGTA